MPDITMSRTRLTYPRYYFPSEATLPPDERELRQKGLWKDKYNNVMPEDEEEKRIRRQRRTISKEEQQKIIHLYFTEKMSITKIAAFMHRDSRRVRMIINPTKWKGKVNIYESA